jgi:hypothetical protein
VIAIDNILVSDEIVEAKFVCDLARCKGGCCEDGDAGAPLENEEVKILPEIYDQVKPYLTSEGVEEIERKGFYYYDREFGWVTPAIGGKMCAYGFRDKEGVIKCGIEQAYYDGKIEWKKPLSCHLFPIKTKKTKAGEIVNYEPREDLCKAACSLGKKLKLPVYQFLRDAIIRKYGEEFYEALDRMAKGRVNGER